MNNFSPPTRNVLYAIGIGIVMVEVVLLTLGLIRDFLGVGVSDEPPIIIGAGLLVGGISIMWVCRDEEESRPVHQMNRGDLVWKEGALLRPEGKP